MSGYSRLKSIRSDRLYILTQSAYTIGRVPVCDIHIESDLLSRQHAALTVMGEKVILRDLGSTNGTFINSMRVHAPTELSHGDVITLGDEKLVFMAPEPPEADRATSQRLSEELAVYMQQDRTSGRTMLRSSFMQTDNWGIEASASSVDSDEEAVEVPLQQYQFDRRRTPAVLLVKSGRRKGSVIELRLPHGAEQHWNLGRSSLSDVVLDDPTVSSEHAIISCERKRWSITDNRSTNGIKLNNIPVKAAVCKSGDVIGIGNVMLEFKIIE